MGNELCENTMQETVAALASRVEDLLIKFSLQPNQRIMVALAGVPGSGKSTVSENLLQILRQKAIVDVVSIPMDGFHFTKKTLQTFSCPKTAFRRRGAPFTFDADAFVRTVACLKNSPVTQKDDPDLAMRLPGFDHAIQDPVSDSVYVPSSARMVIVEGNYLLFDEHPWNKAAPLFDEKWFVDVPFEVAKRRLIERHVRAGIEKNRDDAAVRVQDNDLENAATIRSKLILPDVIIVN